MVAAAQKRLKNFPKPTGKYPQLSFFSKAASLKEKSSEQLFSQTIQQMQTTTSEDKRSHCHCQRQYER